MQKKKKKKEKKNQNTQLTEKSVGITYNSDFPDYPTEKSQYPINKKISGYYPIHQNSLSGALLKHKPVMLLKRYICIVAEALYLNKQFSHLFLIFWGNSLESLTLM